MKKQPYTLTAYIPLKTGHPIPFNTDIKHQNAAHAAGIADNLQLTLYTIPVIQITFTAPPDPLIPQVPKKESQDAALRLLKAEINTRWPTPSGPIKYKLYKATP